MNKHLNHEEIGGGYAMGVRIIIDTTEIEPGVFETMALTQPQGDELAVERSATREEANWAFRDMVQKYAGPLQAAFYRAALQPEARYTIVTLGEFGFPLAQRVTFHSAKLTTYAQYSDAVELIVTPRGKRSQYRMTLYNKSFLIYAGWRELKDSATYNREKNDFGVTMISRYACFDDRYITDIKTMWPDYIAEYDRQPVEKKVVEPKADETISRVPFTLAAGITVVHDAEGCDGPCVDISAEDFEALYAPDAALTPAEKLTNALKRAAIAAAPLIDQEDGGTCNFDAPTLNCELCGLDVKAAKEAVRAAGLMAREWERHDKVLVINGFMSGQGNRRTAMARRFSESLKAQGYVSGMYYQMD